MKLALAPLFLTLVTAGAAAAEEMTPEPTAILQGLDKIAARVPGLRRQPAGMQPAARRAGGGNRESRHPRLAQILRQVAGKNPAVAQCLGELSVIAGTRDLERTELRQMRGDELGVEQPIAA